MRRSGAGACANDTHAADTSASFVAAISRALEWGSHDVDFFRGFSEEVQPRIAGVDHDAVAVCLHAPARPHFRVAPRSRTDHDMT